jgi:hypothetical protein
MGTDWVEIERMGAAARAKGERLSDNPFLDESRRPLDGSEDWDARRDTWSLGWMLEDAFRHQIS